MNMLLNTNTRCTHEYIERTCEDANSTTSTNGTSVHGINSTYGIQVHMTCIYIYNSYHYDKGGTVSHDISNQNCTILKRYLNR